MSKHKEIRLAEVELTEVEDKMILEGYAIIYNDETLIGDEEYGFYETISPDDITACLLYTSSETLSFLQSKILDYFGVSKEIFSSNYSEDEFNSFYEQTIEPLAIQMSEAFSLGLLTDNEIMRGEEIIFYSERRCV